MSIIQRVDFETILEWISNHMTPFRVPTLGFNSHVDVAEGPDDHCFTIIGSNGATQEVTEWLWNEVMGLMPKDSDRRCISTEYNDGHRFKPGIAAICREYWREKKPHCPNETCRHRNICNKR